MKVSKIIVVLLSLAMASGAVAQSKSSTTGVSRNKTTRAAAEAKAQSESSRMKSLYETKSPSESALEYQKVVYRVLDLNKEPNMPLYYPEEPNQDGKNFFFILMDLLAQDKVAAYEYLDGREMFTADYRLKVRDMLERFHIIFTEDKGSTKNSPKFTIENSDIPSNEVLSYYIVERWEFDTNSNKMKKYVDAICPVLHRTDEWGGEPIKYPMFWVKMDDIRHYIAKQYVFTDNDNNLARYNYADYFITSKYKGEIYKTKNLRNLTLAQQFPEPEALKHAQDSIEKRLQSFDKSLWVPSREELLAQAEKNDSIAGKTVKKADAPKKSSRATARSTRSKQSKPKEQKKTSSNNTAVRSVRNRK